MCVRRVVGYSAAEADLGHFRLVVRKAVGHFAWMGSRTGPQRSYKQPTGLLLQML